MRAGLCLAPLLALIACAEADPAARVPPPSDECGASRFQGLIGQDFAVAQALRVEGQRRLIGPNMPISADYRPERLNVEYNTSRAITRISCY